MRPGLKILISTATICFGLFYSSASHAAGITDDQLRQMLKFQATSFPEAPDCAEDHLQAREEMFNGTIVRAEYVAAVRTGDLVAGNAAKCALISTPNYYPAWSAYIGKILTMVGQSALRADLNTAAVQASIHRAKVFLDYAYAHGDKGAEKNLTAYRAAFGDEE